MAMSMNRGFSVDDLLNALVYDNVTPMSLTELLRWGFGDVGQLCDHFEAITVGDLPQDYTVTVVGGAAANLYLDDEPSAIQLDTGAILNDSVAVETDRTVSLLELGGTVLVAEWRAKINNEANIRWDLQIRNPTTNVDLVGFIIQTTAAPPRDTGCGRCWVDGVAAYTPLNLIGLYNLLVYHTFRVEYTPGVSVGFYVDDQLIGTEAVPGNIPVDQSWSVRMYCQALAAAQRTTEIDYFKVWAE